MSTAYVPEGPSVFAHLAPRATAGLAAALAASLAAIGAPPASADVILPGPQQVDATVRAACTALTPAPDGSPAPRARTIDVQVRGELPLSSTPGKSFTFDRLTTRFVLDPDVVRPQIEGTRGSLNARLDDLGLLADGAGPNPAAVVSPKAPLDLGTQPVKIASSPAFDAPPGAPKATFDPAGPWTVNGDAGGVAVGLAPFALTLTYYPEPTPTTKFAPIVTSVVCKPQSPWFAKFPVYPAGQPLPTVTGLSPNIAAGGQVVTITGTGLADATEVTFGGNPAAFKVASATQLTAVVPTLYWFVAPPPTLQWDVAVTTSAGTSANTAADDFTYLTGTPFGPVITRVTPSVVPVSGGKVVVAGRGFKGTTSVVVGRKAAKFSVTADGSVTVAAPAQLVRGNYLLRLTTPAGSATATLSYR